MKPFLLGRKALDGQSLRTCHEFAPPVPTGTVRPAPSGPVVDVVKEGDKIVRLVITCSCGEKIEVECLYPAGG